jgi:DNA-directed RNA polymerase I, II, and III subunit RPABC1
MSNNSTIVSSLYKSRNTILEQLKERGYDVSNYEDFNINEVHVIYNSKQMDMLVSNEEGHKVYIKYHIEKKLTPNHVHNTINDLFEIENILNKETDQIIFVIKDEPTETLVDLMSHLYHSENVFISIFNIKRLQFNILKHSLVPKHTILTPLEEQKMMEFYNISDKTQIPTISRFDPVAMIIGLKPTQICKIVRPSKTAIEGVFYRVCV